MGIDWYLPISIAVFIVVGAVLDILTLTLQEKANKISSNKSECYYRLCHNKKLALMS